MVSQSRSWCVFAHLSSLVDLRVLYGTLVTFVKDFGRKISVYWLA